MSLLIVDTKSVFDTESIKKGYLIWAKHELWDDARSGIVMYVDQNKIRALYHPGIANVTCFYEIPASEVAEGKWEIRWSENLQSIESFVPEGETENDV